ncbi:MAG: transglycosylase domain-containing protein, partial [Chitinophagales bacterium]|nr:transglycosylase domain-containing protein [Chitinophagales bacterium]
MNRGVLIWFWSLFVIGVLSVAAIFFFIGAGWLGEMPSFEQLENPSTAHSTQIISTDNVVIGKFYLQNRSDIAFDNLNDNVRHALQATEDIRFFEHTGVDLRALLRVVKGALTGDSQGGGSTITQQLAKNLFPREKNQSKLQLVFRKLKEWIIAVRLERSYTKEEIMAMYLNTVEFSDNAFGIKSAAYTYFGKPVDSLRVEEAAVLVGMLKAPYQFNPRIHPQAAQQRRNVVIDQMYRYDYLSRDKRDSLFKLPVALDFHPDTHTEGMAPYFR